MLEKFFKGKVKGHGVSEVPSNRPFLLELIPLNCLLSYSNQLKYPYKPTRLCFQYFTEPSYRIGFNKNKYETTTVTFKRN